MNIALVPVRAGSKSIKNKNIKFFYKKPLVYWVLKSLEKTKIIDKIFLATDSDLIASTAKIFNFKKLNIFKRSKKSSRDTSPTEEVLLEFLKKNSFEGNDYIFLVQATNPFVNSKDFEIAFRKLKKTKKKSLLSVTKSGQFLWSESGKSINYNFKKRPRRQEFKKNYVENGSFYINTVKNILKSKNRLTSPVSFHVMKNYTSFEIDEPKDWLIAEFIKSKIVK